MKKAADITAKADFLEQPERWSGDGVARGRTITAGTRRPWNMELWHWNFPRVSLGWSVKQWIHMLVVWNGVDGFCLIALTTWRNLYSECVCVWNIWIDVKLLTHFSVTFWLELQKRRGVVGILGVTTQRRHSKFAVICNLDADCTYLHFRYSNRLS